MWLPSHTAGRTARQFCVRVCLFMALGLATTGLTAIAFATLTPNAGFTVRGATLAPTGVVVDITSVGVRSDVWIEGATYGALWIDRSGRICTKEPEGITHSDVRDLTTGTVCSRVILRRRVGWPTPSFEGTLYASPPDVSIDFVHRAVPPQAETRSALLATSLARHGSIPVRPIWLGVVINSGFAAAVLGTVFLLLRTLQRCIRMRRRRCARCSHALEPPQSSCPECGTARASPSSLRGTLFGATLLAMLAVALLLTPVPRAPSIHRSDIAGCNVVRALSAACDSAYAWQSPPPDPMVFQLRREPGSYGFYLRFSNRIGDHAFVTVSGDCVVTRYSPGR